MARGCGAAADATRSVIARSRVFAASSVSRVAASRSHRSRVAAPPHRLQNVTHIDHLLALQSNRALADLALTGLVSIDGDLKISAMASLTSLSGLDTLTLLSGDIDITDNDQLPATDIVAFTQRLGR